MTTPQAQKQINLSREKALRNFQTKIWTDWYYEKCEEDIDSLKELDDDFKEAYAYVQSKKSDREIRGGRWVFVTINPKPEIDSTPDVFVKAIAKIAKKSWVNGYCYAFEQRSDNIDTWHGMHVHMLLEKGKYRPYNVKQEIYNTVKSMVGSPDHVNCKFIPEDAVLQKLKYIYGEKVEEKMGVVRVDTEWRVQLGLDYLYESKNLYNLYAHPLT